MVLDYEGNDGLLHMWYLDSSVPDKWKTQTLKLDPSFAPYMKINSNWVRHKCEPKYFKHFKIYMRTYFHDFVDKEDFF